MYHWTRNEFDALVSFAYNIGNIDQLTNYGKRSRDLIAIKMLQYNKSGGKVIEGLNTRRRAEMALFLFGSKIYHTTANVNLRSSRSTKKDNIILVIPNNFNIRIIGETKTWYQVGDVIGFENRAVGWIKKDYAKEGRY